MNPDMKRHADSSAADLAEQEFKRRRVKAIRTTGDPRSVNSVDPDTPAAPLARGLLGTIAYILGWSH